MGAMRVPRSLLAAIAVAVAVAAFGNSMHNDFAFDDHFAIVRNADSLGKGTLLQVWKNDFWGQDIASADSHKSYRPLTVLSFRFNTWLDRNLRGEEAQKGSTSVEGLLEEESSWAWKTKEELHRRYRQYSQESSRLRKEPLSPDVPAAETFHWVNLLLHVIACVLLMRVYAIAFQDVNGMPDFGCVAAVLLFALHPIHTEAVTGLVGRAELLCAVFVLLSILAYDRAMHSGMAGMAAWLAVAAMCFAASTLSKETGFTAAGLLVMQELLLSRRGLPWERTDVSAAALRIATVFGMAYAYICFRAWITVHFTVSIYRQLENPVAFVEDPLARGLSSAYIHWRYFRLLLLPWPLSCDYSYQCIPMIERWTDPRVLAPVGMYVVGVLAVAALSWAVYQGSQHARGLLWAVSFVVCTFLPASNIVFWVGTLIGERLLYLPSVGFTIGVGWLLGHIPNLCQSSSWRRWLQIGVAAFLASSLCWCGARTLERNEHWRTEESVFFNALEVCDRSAKVHENVGIVHRRYERWEEALQEFRLARQLWPDYCELDYWEGLTLLQSGKREEGVSYLRKAVACKYTSAKAMLVLQKVLLGSADAQENHLWGNVLASRDEALASDHLRRSAALHITAATEAAARGLEASIVNGHYLQAMEALKDAEGLLELQQSRVGWCEVKYLQGVCMKQVGHDLAAFDSYIGALKCESTKLLAGEAMLMLQQEHVGEAAFHERWAVAMVELNDPAQAITHLRVAALLYLDQESTDTVECKRTCRAGAALARHLLAATHEGDPDWDVLHAVLEDFASIEERAIQSLMIDGDNGAGRLHESSI